jgi:hypothetical protein
LFEQYKARKEEEITALKEQLEQQQQPQQEDKELSGLVDNYKLWYNYDKKAARNISRVILECTRMKSRNNKFDLN